MYGGVDQKSVCGSAIQIKKGVQDGEGCNRDQGEYVNIWVGEYAQEAWCMSRRVHRDVAGPGKVCEVQHGLGRMREGMAQVQEGVQII